jgi:predicted RNase H-like HicB family nuclease
MKLGRFPSYHTFSMQLSLTQVFRKVPSGYVGFVEELPGANTQGVTLEETRQNLAEAIQLILEANRFLAEEALGSDVVLKENLEFMSA